MRYHQKSSMGSGLLFVLLQGFLFLVHAPLHAAEIHVSPAGSTPLNTTGYGTAIPRRRTPGARMAAAGLEAGP
jgi:hypothetical protein